MATPTYRIRGTHIERENVPAEWAARARPELRVERPDFTPDLEEAISRAQQLWTLPPGTQEWSPERSLQGLKAALIPREGPELPQAQISATPRRGILSRLGESLSQQPLVRAAGTPLGQAMLGEMIPFGALLPRFRRTPVAAEAATKLLPAGTAGAVPRIRGEMTAFPRQVRAATAPPAVPPAHYLEAQQAAAFEGLRRAATPELSSLRGTGHVSPDVSRFSEGVRSEALSPDIEDLFIDDIPMREFLTKDYSELIRR